MLNDCLISVDTAYLFVNQSSIDFVVRHSQHRALSLYKSVYIGLIKHFYTLYYRI